MPASSGMVLSTKVKNLMPLSLLNKNFKFFHACQLGTKVNNLMLLSLFNKTPSSSMPASSGMVLSTKVTVETITTDMEKNAHTCDKKQKCIISQNIQNF